MTLAKLISRFTIVGATMVAALLPVSGYAEDIDIFLGTVTNGAAANVLIIIDNSTNYAARSEGWPGGITQGQAELRALQGAISRLNDNVNVGVMMFADNKTGNNGGYVRYAIRPMTAPNRTTLTNLLAQMDVNIGSKVPQESAGSNLNYSAVLLDAYKYFGGGTGRCDLAQVNGSGTAVHVGYDHIPPGYADVGSLFGFPGAYTDTTLTCYLPPSSAGPCGGKNYIVFVGNTFPNADIAPGEDYSEFLQKLGGDTTQIYSSIKPRYADEWTRFLYGADTNPDMDGVQNITTYTIDVYNRKSDADQTKLLKSMALAGERYYVAQSQADIESDFTKIFLEIQSVNTAFASVSLPISATNRAESGNEVFIGMFRPDPDARPRWLGNLKRYQLANFGTYAEPDIKLADAAGMDAVNTLSGFIADCAASFWTTDSGKYWASVAMNPSPKGACPSSLTAFDAYSDAPDGPKVEKGSVAEVLRKGNDPSAAPTWTLNRNMLTKGFVKFDSGNVTSAELSAADVAFVKGLNVDSSGTTVTMTFDVDGSGTMQDTTIRPSIHGDVIHSRPLPVNYGAAGTAVFYGANDGTYRAFDAVTGVELWAYVAPEFYPSLPRLRQNEPLISYPGVAALGLIPTPMPKDYYFDGSTGIYQNADNSKVWIFPTMRRGGRMIYAFDVTDPAAPSLKWKRGCPNLTSDTGCSAGFAGIGQTWSTPSLALMKVGGTVAESPKPIIVVGGGYDRCEDGSANGSCTGAKGSIIYVIDADTGTVLQSFATLARVVADVALVDVDYDGIPDFAYAADTRGNVYRISFGLSKTAPLAAGSWTAARAAFTTGGSRKFLYAPALLPAFDKTTGKYYIYVALGSGDREQPLATQYPYTTPVLNRFYVYLDDVTRATATNLDDATAMSDFTSLTACGSSLLLPGTGKAGWFMDLEQYGRGEQTVTSAVIVGGLLAFSTNRPVVARPNVCAPLGEARGYFVNLFNASGAIGAQDMTCGGSRSSTFAGGGLPPSPVVATVKVDDKYETVCVGCAKKFTACPPGATDCSSAVQAQQVFTLKPQRRSRVYWKREGID